MASEINRRIASAISLFTSMQAVQIVCSILRTKIITLWLGAPGVALAGIYQTVLDLISAVTQLGMRTSAVKDIAARPDGGTVTVVRRFGVWLGVLGAVVAVALCVPLSRWSFGEPDHAWSFCLLGAALFMQSLCGAEQAVAQGLGRLKPLANAGVIGAVAGLLLSLPLYRFCGLDGVVPSLIVYSVALWVPLWVMRPRDVGRLHVSVADTLRRGAGFIKVGAYVTLMSILGYVVNYLMLMYMRRHGTGLDTVALYTAGYTMLWRYVGMIYVSVSYEFYPRLAGVAESRQRVAVMVNHQSLFVLLLMVPCACGAIAVAPMLVSLLYDAEFAPMIPYFVFGMSATLFRPASVSMSYTFLAMGRGRLYCISELVSSLIMFAVNVAGFHLGGFTGLGLAQMAGMGLDLLVVNVCYRSLGLRLKPRVVWLTLLLAAVTFVCGAMRLGGHWWVPAAAALLSVYPLVRFFRR